MNKTDENICSKGEHKNIEVAIYNNLLNKVVKKRVCSKCLLPEDAQEAYEIMNRLFNLGEKK